MPDPEVENRSEFYPKQKDKFLLPACVEERDDTLMDFDLDQDSSWPLYQFTSLISNPTSPILICASDQPCTPLWASIDGDNDENSKLPDQANSVPSTSNSCLNRESRIHQSHLFVPKPIDSPDGYCLMKERMTQALRFFKESTEQHILAQVWAPVKTGGQYVLTTSGQPFVLDPQSIGLHQYRMVSLMYVFSLDSEKDEVLGLPGRVFRQKLPEWTPNVQYYSSREYPRLTHALHYNVQGSLALPIFESSGQTCVGVIELITTAPKINYAPEVEIICKALEAVNLKSSEILDHPNIQICNEGRQNALGEILEVLSAVCEMHKLPLAQTWVPCKHRSVLAYNGGFRKSCTSFDGSCNGKVCMSTTDVAFYVIDAHMWGFRGACLEHHLQKGQGVSGRAFLSQSLSFCSNITRFCKKEYPLAHYALMFGLKSCFAICLKSSFTGDDEYVLEFFLPSSIVEDIEQKIFLGSLLGTMKQHFRTLKVASGIEFEEDKVFVEIIQGSENDGLDFRFECIQIPQSIELPPESTDLVQKAADLVLDAGDSFEKWVLNDGSKPIHEGEIQNPVPFPPQIRDTNKKPVERKRGKTEKSINLEVLQQYFAGSLKDAARSLGVCPTTMKRICRQHGISRWPSRKINKVNRSLSKLKRVIESVQVAEGTFGLNSLTKNTNPSNAKNGSEPEAQIENKESPASTTPQNEVQVEMEDHHDLPREGGPSSSSPEEPIHEQNSKTGSGSREEEGSALAPTSNGSCQGSPTYEMPRAVIPDNILLTGKNDEPFRGMLVEEPFGGMLVEDSGSSKDLKNLCPPGGMDSILDEQVLTNNHSTMDVLPQTMSTLVGGGDMGRFTIKATYKEDMIIRFRIPSGSGIMDLKEEVAKRLKLEVDTFDIKYIDDDNEWVLIACDADLQECVEISKSSGSNIIRLLVNDIIPSLGSSGESSWQ